MGLTFKPRHPEMGAGKGDPMTHMIFSDTRCALGEGPLWHPERRSLFWFDILGHRLYERGAGAQTVWQFDEHVSAAGWVDADTLLMASETGLYRFDIATGARDLVVALEAGNAATRSNDGRADPQGGFWIGTMGKAAEPGAGAIYRYHRGALRLLFPEITIPNAICFAPGGGLAYFCDTTEGVIRRVALDAEGWPSGASEVFIDLRGEGLNPDGAVVDAQGNLWNAQWGASRVACYDTRGRFVTAIGFPAGQTSCPAFGGTDLATLYVTSAAHEAGPGDSLAGATFSAVVSTQGQREHRVIL